MSENNQQPIYILPQDTARSRGREAQKNNIMAAKLVADTIRTTLGPKGMDKMLVDSMNEIIVTNDGVTILEEMQIEHPAAKMIVEVAKTQENEVGDGTTTAVIIAGELLKKAEALIDQEVHPTVIAKGYRMAAEKAIEILNNISENLIENDRETLKKIAQTAMNGKGAESKKELLSELIVNAVQSILENNQINLDNIKIEKKTGDGIENSELIKGIVIDKERVHSEMPKQVQNAKIALLDLPLEIKNTEIDAKIQITDPSQMSAFLEQEENMLKQMAEKIIKSGANVILTQKGVDDIVQYYLAKSNIFCARRLKKSDMEKLSRATGAKLVSNLDDLKETDLGQAGLVEEQRIGNEEMTFIRECPNPKSVTLLLRGGTEHVIAEIERAVQDSLGVIKSALKTGKVVAGAGSTEIELAKELRSYSNTLSGREQLAVKSFAESLELIPRTLAENAGLDPIDMLTELKSQHQLGNKWHGINVFTGKIEDAWKNSVIEPLQIKTQAIKSASEVAELILRIDDIIASGAPKGQQQMSQGMPPGMM